MLRMCFSTAPSLTTSCAADRRVGPALGHQPRAPRARAGSAGERVVPAAPHHQLRHHLRVEDRAAGGDRPQPVEELVDVDDPVLEQVADPAPARRRAGRRRRTPPRTGTGSAPACPGSRRRASTAARRPSSVKVGGIRTSTTDDVGPVLGDGLDQRRRRRPPPRPPRSRTPPAAGPGPPASAPRRRPRLRARNLRSDRPSAPRRASRPRARRRPPAAGRPGPARPCPLATWAPPTPSSPMVSIRTSPVAAQRRPCRSWPGCAWRRWSATRRPRSRRCSPPRPAKRSTVPTSSSTGMVQRPASAASAGARPRSVRIGGAMPRESARSSSRVSRVR